MTTMADKELNQDHVMAFLIKVSGDAAAALGGVSISIGDRLGLYQAMAGAGPLTSTQLAERTGVNERYLREWLADQAGLHYLDYDAATDAFELDAVHAAVLADPAAPTRLPVIPGGFAAVEAEYIYRMGRDTPADKLEWTPEEALDYVGDLLVGVEFAASPLAAINVLGPRVVAAEKVAPPLH